MILSIQRNFTPGKGLFSRKFPPGFLPPTSLLVDSRSSREETNKHGSRSLIYRPDTALPAFQTFTPIIKRPHLDEIAKVIDSFLMAVSCTLSPSHFVRFSFSTQMSRVQPSRRNRNATKLETDKEGAPAGIRIYNNRSFGGPAWWWQVWFIRGNLVAIYDDRVNRLRVTSISVNGSRQQSYLRFVSSVFDGYGYTLLRTTQPRLYEYLDVSRDLTIRWKTVEFESCVFFSS